MEAEMTLNDGGDTSGERRDATGHFVDRYAHPYFEPGAAERELLNTRRRITDWSKTQLGPVPTPLRGGRISLNEIIGDEGVREIEELGEIRFHALGDSGVNHAEEAEQVAEDMAADFKPGAGGLNPAFLLHLGDVVYGAGKGTHYGERFYKPYRRYPGKIIAIPGNHDGEVKSDADSPSLKDFLANFCTEEPQISPQASGSGIFRQTMTLPGAYWYLDAPFVRIIGLYSNRLENPGYLEGLQADGSDDKSQLQWLEAVLREITGEQQQKALIVATHHPPYSQSGHSGSTEMHRCIIEIADRVGIIPDAFLSGHAHNYQRYTRRGGGRQVPYYVTGTGGINPQHVQPATGSPADESRTTTYDAALSSLGYLFITVSPTQLKTEFWRLSSEYTTAFDPVTLDLADHTLR
ncbi:metallophosphoesterase (plasmid) [Rhizobium sp. CCGE 510]|nr:metallophosphoesterase [Rhizobium sp. CCGE 510]